MHETARYDPDMPISVQHMPTSERVRIKNIQTLSDNWYVLKKTTFDFLRGDGTWQQQSRETYDRGNGATLLLYNQERRTVILTRQFRFPAFVNGHSGLLIEAAAGLLDGAAPEERIKAEVEEETGYRVHNVQKVFEAFMSPGSVTEKLYFFVAAYDASSKTASGGGNRAEGEDIEILELSIEDAMRAIAGGEIVDGKTIMLLQHAFLSIFASPGREEFTHAGLKGL
jgi:nudix-type nucleoside diphosphatase (YffH/AdpP family)